MMRSVSLFRKQVVAYCDYMQLYYLAYSCLILTPLDEVPYAFDLSKEWLYSHQSEGHVFSFFHSGQVSLFRFDNSLYSVAFCRLDKKMILYAELSDLGIVKHSIRRF